MANIKNKIDLVTKIRNFFKYNWWLMWITNLAICIFVYYVAGDIKNQHKRVMDLLAKEVQGVVFIGQNGQVVFGEKTLMDASTDTKFRVAIKNNLVNYLITDASRLTKDYTISIKSPDDVFDNSAVLREFGENYMAFNNQKYPQAFGYYKTLLAGLSQAISADTLPEQIIPLDSSISTYTWNDQEQVFEIVVNVLAKSYIYEPTRNIFRQKDATIQIRAKGFYDLANGTIINPLGIKYYEIGLTNAKK